MDFVRVFILFVIRGKVVSNVNRINVIKVNFANVFNNNFDNDITHEGIRKVVMSINNVNVLDICSINFFNI